MPDIDRAIRDGLDAWDRDDRNRLASLAGQAGLVWYEPGAWNCHLSATLWELLRQCQTQGTGGPYRWHAQRIDKATLITAPTSRSAATANARERQRSVLAENR